MNGVPFEGNTFDEVYDIRHNREEGLQVAAQPLSSNHLAGSE